MRAGRLLRIVALSACAVALTAAPAAAQIVYFDAHNHFSGVLPFYAYADLPAFVDGISQGSRAVTFDDRLALYRYLTTVWYPSAGAALGNRTFSPADGQRFSLGARAALLVYSNRVGDSALALDGVLERVLTATPWTEFDSAYAFRGGPAATYLLQRYYGNDSAHLSDDLCRASVLELARTNIGISEQSVSFVGGWGMHDGRSDKLDTIRCVMGAKNDPTVVAGLRSMNRPMPVVRFVLMTHTSQLATLAGGATYSDWSTTGRCARVSMPAGLRTSPQTIYHALLGEDDAGSAVVEPAQRSTFLNDVVGIDTAGPETTCFTPQGMAYYRDLIGAVYDAAKARRALGWHGKLLVHTHVGEGAAIDYAPQAPPQPWTFANAFQRLPSQIGNRTQAAANIDALLAAIAQVQRERPDVNDYVVFRLAHDTWADDAQAAAMRSEGVEADVSLESNVATGAYPIDRMPLGAETVLRDRIDPLIENEEANFSLDDLLGALVRDPDDPLQTGDILGAASLRYLLERHVRCLLGTDAAGVEHSDIAKEYRYASALIAYWNQTDPRFRARAGAVSERTLFDDVARHLQDMGSDARIPYAEPGD